MQFDPWLWTKSVGRNRIHALELQSLVQDLSDDVLRTEHTLLPLPMWFLRPRLIEELQRQHRAYELRNSDAVTPPLTPLSPLSEESDSSVPSHPGL